MTRQIRLACAAILALAAPALAQTPAMQEGNVTAEFVDGSGAAVGKATITPTPTGVLFAVEVSGLPASQWVAFHVHETGTCDPATHHNSAGGHFNPTGAEHGYRAAKGPHAGDMPNQWVGTDGVLRAQVFNTAVTLDPGERSIRGRALMIHAKGDDYNSQPSGNAGDRLACAPVPDGP